MALIQYLVLLTGSFLLGFLSVPSSQDQQQHVHNQLQNETRPNFYISNDMFWKDGEPFRIFGGDIHYFRVHPNYWKDRLLRIKSLGLNTIQTYVPWNLHEPKQEEYNFEGIADLQTFLKLAKELDLLVMLRIGPYICAEWDFGGFPAWLLAHQPSLHLRSSDPAFLELVDKWWSVLLPKISELLYENGGAVIMVQVENEFGSYGNDPGYLKHLVAEARFHLGKDVIIYTTDGGSKGNLENGTLPGDDVYTAVDFPIDWDASGVFELQKTFNAPGKSPSLVSEFYTGWLTHWHEKIASTSSQQTADALDKILSLNASVVLYMAHGGTNFGFFSGANSGDMPSIYSADITSYDYDAPISEAGDVDHAKFTDLRRIFAEHSQLSLPPAPSIPLRIAYGRIMVGKVANLLEIIEHVSVPSHGIKKDAPITMESLNQISGFILYESKLPAYSKSGSSLSIPEVHDRAQIFVWTKSETGNAEPCYLGKIERWSNQNLTLPSFGDLPGSKLQILVENMGRLNYGPFIFDPKGILSSVLLDGVPVMDWTMYPIPLDDISSLTSKIVASLNLKMNSPATCLQESLQSPVVSTCGSDNSSTGIGFYSSSFQIEEPADTFMSMKGWTKGLAFVNGFNLGRYWTAAGPQCTLYIPGPVLKVGKNELLIFELEVPNSTLEVELVNQPDFTCDSIQIQ